MHKSDLEKAEVKVKELFDIIQKTTYENRKEISWDELTKIRLQTMKNGETWQNAVRIAILNFVQKYSPNENPALPKEVIDFLRPVLVSL